MKKLIFGVLLIGAAAAALPAWFGYRAESQLREALAESDAAPYVSVQVTRYERGWLHSRGVLELRLNDDYVDALMASSGADAKDADGVRQALQQGSVTLQLQVAHGPLVLEPERYVGAAWTRLTLTAPDELRALIPAVGELMQVTARTGFDGDADIVATVPALQHRNGDGVEFAFSGADLKGHYEDSEQRLRGRFTMGSLEITDGDSRFRLDGLHVDSDTTRLSRAVHLTEAVAGIDAISVTSRDPAVGVVEVAGLELATRVEPGQTDGRLDLSAEYRLGSLLTPQMTLTDGRFGVAVRNVGIESLEAYDAWSQAMTLSGGRDDALMAELAQLATRFLRDGPVIEIEPLSARYNGQPVDARFRVTVNAAAVPAADRLQLLDPEALLGAFDLEGDVAAASALIRQIAATRMLEGARAELTSQGNELSDAELAAMVEPQVDAILDGLLQQGFLRRDGDLYRVDLTFRNGQAAVNGQVMPLPM